MERAAGHDADALDSRGDAGRLIDAGADALDAGEVERALGLFSRAATSDLPSLAGRGAIGAAEALVRLGRDGADQPGGVKRFSFPRSDLKVMLDGVEVKPGLALGSWLAFQPMEGADAMVMGDLVLTQDEIAPVTKKLLDSGIDGRDGSVLVHQYVNLYATLRDGGRRWYGAVGAPHPPLAGELLAALPARGPLGSRHFEGSGDGGMWGWKPAKAIQKPHEPSRSSNTLPVIFGHQKTMAAIAPKRPAPISMKWKCATTNMLPCMYWSTGVSER